MAGHRNDVAKSNAARLRVGTPVATLRLFSADGRFHEWILRAGEDSGEWAAERPDVRKEPGFAAPDPWIHWIPPGGGFFAQRYRSRWVVPSSLPVRLLEIELAPELAGRVSLAVLSLELRS